MNKIFILLILFGFLFILFWFYDYDEKEKEKEKVNIPKPVNEDDLENSNLQSFDSDVLWQSEPTSIGTTFPLD